MSNVFDVDRKSRSDFPDTYVVMLSRTGVQPFLSFLCVTDKYICDREFLLGRNPNNAEALICLGPCYCTERLLQSNCQGCGADQ